MSERPTSSTRGLGFLIADINRFMRKEFDRRVRWLGLTRAQWLFITHLSRQPGCTQSELAESLQLEKITVSRQARRLVRGGWIVRRMRTDDGRAYCLQPTPKAARLSAKLATVAAGLREDYLQGLPLGRRLALIQDLLCIKANLLALEATAKGKIAGHFSRHESQAAR